MLIFFIGITGNNHLMRKIFLLFGLLLSACSTMKPEECYNANWRDIGYNDAIQGRKVWLQSRTQACAKVKLKPDRKAYLAGHQVGSKQFCNYKNGFIRGRIGNDKTKICIAPNLAKPFYDGYKDGLEVYQREQDLMESMYETRRRLHRMRHHYHKH